MTIKLGADNINKVYIGESEASRIYLGEDLVWPDAPAPTLGTDTDGDTNV